MSYVRQAARWTLAGLGLAAAVASLTTTWIDEACTEDEPVSMISEGHGIFVPDTQKDTYRRAVPTVFMVLAIPSWNTATPAAAAAILMLAWAVLHAAVNVLMGEVCPGKTDPTLGPGGFAAYAAAVAAAWALASGIKPHSA